jgi:hypothetical protein
VRSTGRGRPLIASALSPTPLPHAGEGTRVHTAFTRMSLTLANLLLTLAGGYLGAGAIFALAFVTAGVGRIDPASRGVPLGFRLLIAPGVILLWPYLALRWWRADRGLPVECSAHIRAARQSPP